MAPRIPRRPARATVDRALRDVAELWHPPPDSKEKAAGAGTEAANFKTIISATILPRHPARRNCDQCGIAFRAIRAWHTRCAKCYRWTLAGYYNALAAAALRGTR